MLPNFIMLPNFVLALGPPVLMLVGLASLWAKSRLQTRTRGTREGSLTLGLAVLGWTLLLVGLFALVGLMTHVACLFGWLATAGVLVCIRGRDRNLELRALLWNLMIAAERSIPLDAAARAFAAERGGRLGNRAIDLADYLEAGLPLALALQRSGHRCPPAVLLAANLGQQTGQLGPALRQALGRSDEFEVLLRSTTEKLFYLGFLVVFGLGIWTFILLKIMPVFQKIFQEFGLQLPAVTQGIIAASSFAVSSWPLILLLALVVLVFLVGALLYYAGWSPRLLPGLGWLWWRADCAVILRWLATAVRQERPLTEMVRLLAGYFPQRSLRRRLEGSAKRIDHGADWCDCLYQAGVIRRPEQAVFQAAARTGNLAWALDEMADSSVRRSAYRLRAFLNVAFPLVVMLYGGGVFAVAAGVLLPLFSLIQSLS